MSGSEILRAAELSPFPSLGRSVRPTRSVRMVSYKRLNPEDVQFSHTALSEEPRHAQEEVSVSPCVRFLKRRLSSCELKLHALSQNAVNKSGRL